MTDQHDFKELYKQIDYIEKMSEHFRQRFKNSPGDERREKLQSLLETVLSNLLELKKEKGGGSYVGDTLIWITARAGGAELLNYQINYMTGTVKLHKDTISTISPTNPNYDKYKKNSKKDIKMWESVIKSLTELKQLKERT